MRQICFYKLLQEQKGSVCGLTPQALPFYAPENGSARNVRSFLRSCVPKWDVRIFRQIERDVDLEQTPHTRRSSASLLQIHSSENLSKRRISAL